jgi:hypothetical protein
VQKIKIKSLKYILSSLFAICCFITACKKDNTNQQQAPFRLCEKYNPEYVYINGSDTAICFIPNCFTPNGDGINDAFEVFGRNIQSATITVSYGQTVLWHTDSAMAKWWFAFPDSLTDAEKNYSVSLTGIDSFGNSFSLSGVVGLLNYNPYGPLTAHPHHVNCDTCAFPCQWDGDSFRSIYPTNEFYPDTSGIVCD